MEEKKALRGGEFLIRESEAADIFIPEEFNEEQKMIADTCNDFLEAEIFPVIERMNSMEPGLMRGLLSKAGELGMLGISIPEEFMGFGQNFVTSMLVSEVTGAGYSFSVAMSCHTGIGTLPILYYGSEEQKQKYLPKLATAEWVGAYCLTEPDAGSDANSGRTKANLSEDKTHYILNGQKMWITNGGFADVFTVFAKLDGDRVLSAFIVDKDFPGISFNPEEKKMGIKGSSTVQVFFNDCIVPVENMLGSRGDGFRIALNILNLGRIKLGANVLGASKRAITQSVNYANERKQFRVLISQFGAIQYKMAEMVIRTFAAESAVYRASQNIDEAIQTYINGGMDKGMANVEAQRDYSIEAAILKVYGSEILDYVVDEGVQIHGGMGFSSETQIETSYRDSRINRIFEGTNEINRMVIVDILVSKGMKKELDIFEVAAGLIDDLSSISMTPTFSDDYFTAKAEMIQGFKKLALILLRSLSDKFKGQLSTEQELLFNVSNIVMQIYIAESTMLRVEKLKDFKDEEMYTLYCDMLDVVVHDSAGIIFKQAYDAIHSFAEDNKDLLFKGLHNYTSIPGINVKDARRRIAAKLIDENRYCF